jgi:hypothetical protein
MPIELTKLPEEQLLRLLLNCIRKSANGDQVALELAERCIAEMDRRSAESAEEPVLRRVGYCVGNRGLRWNDRKFLLDYILEQPLPVHAHWSGDWGEPGSRQRYAKLRKTLIVYVERFGGRPGMLHAETNWRHDADYVRKIWQQKSKSEQ